MEGEMVLPDLWTVAILATLAVLRLFKSTDGKDLKIFRLSAVHTIMVHTLGPYNEMMKVS